MGFLDFDANPQSSTTHERFFVFLYSFSIFFLLVQGLPTNVPTSKVA